MQIYCMAIHTMIAMHNTVYTLALNEKKASFPYKPAFSIKLPVEINRKAIHDTKEMLICFERKQ